MKNNKPLYQVLHIYIPSRIMDYLGNRSEDYTIFQVLKLEKYFFKLFEKYKSMAHYQKRGNHLALKHMGDYQTDIFPLDTLEQIREHLKEYFVTRTDMVSQRLEL
jgi:hypothetical protein